MSSAHSAPRVLVVEDDRVVAEVLGTGLRRPGYEVTVAGDGARFADVIDAALLFITASDSLQDRLTGFDAGADDYRKRGGPGASTADRGAALALADVAPAAARSTTPDVGKR